MPTFYSRAVPVWVAPIVFGLAATCHSSAAPTAPDTGGSPPKEVLVLGDSLAVSPSKSQGFPSHLQASINAAGLNWTVNNAGVSGDTTADGLRRLPALLDSEVGALIVALGANDGLRGVPVATVEAQLASIIELARAQAIPVLLCGLETPPAYGFQYSIDFHHIYPRLASRYDIPLVPFLLAGVALNPELNEPDGVHPNAAGARRIAETIWPYLQPMLQNSRQSSVNGLPSLQRRPR
jgi:acyl-CoA thioesterase-1